MVLSEGNKTYKPLKISNVGSETEVLNVNVLSDCSEAMKIYSPKDSDILKSLI